MTISRRRLFLLRMREERRGLACIYCLRSLTEDEVTIEHLTPKSRGGTDAWENLEMACLGCNAKRGNASLVAFMRQVDMARSRKTQIKKLAKRLAVEWSKERRVA